MTALIQTDALTHINNDQQFLVCCFYTSSYKEHAMRLKESLDTFNVGYYFSEVEDAGYWEGNTRLKPHFIQECLELFPEKDVLYLDADAVIKKPINYFNSITKDIALYKATGLPGMSHNYLAGTMFFKNNQLTRDFVNQWIAEQKNGKKTQVDQDSLDEAMIKFENKLSVEPLPAGYIKIFDKDYEGEVYIEQYQASRNHVKLRRKLIRRRNKLLILGAIATLATTILLLKN